jgi:hypothetical protein
MSAARESWYDGSIVADADGTLQIDVPRFLAHLRVRDTPANRDAAMEEIRKVVAELWPGVPVVTTDRRVL